MKKLLEKDESIFWLLVPGKDVRLRSQFQELRYRTFRKEDRNATGKETDTYDAHADYIVCMKKGKMVGGCRMIFGKIEELPIGKAATKTNTMPSMEISRLIADSTQTKCLLFSLIYKQAEKRGVDQILAFARRGLVRMLQKEKLDVFEILGEPYEYRGLTLVPLAFRVSSAPSFIKKHLKKM